MAGIIRRGKTWHFRWVVPQAYREVAGRREIVRSLKTDSESEALERARELERKLRGEFEAMLQGCSLGDPDRFARTVRIAAGLGLPYRTAAEIAAGDLVDILERVDTARRLAPAAEKPAIVAAVLGGDERPKLMVSGLVDKALELYERDNRFKNPKQLKRWVTERRRACANLIKAIGRDIPVEEIDETIAGRHAAWAEEQVKAGRRGMESANKDFAYLSSMLVRYWRALGVKTPPRPYAGISITDKHREPQARRPLPDDWMIEHVINGASTAALNPQARDILIIVCETGCRPSEVYRLPEAAIHLDHPDGPHFRIENSDVNGQKREIKTSQSRRPVPLVGAALEAIRRNPKGFPRYRDRGDWSTTVNNHLRRVLPEGCTIYGARHAYEDRMKAAGIPNDDRAAMMGHSQRGARGREVYGELTLRQRFEIARRVSLSWCDWPR